MKTKIIVSWLLLAASVALGIVSFCLLPQSVVTQFSAGSSNVTTMPKFFAVLLPFLLGTGGAISSLLGKYDEKKIGKSLLISLLGIVLFVIMLVVNL